MEVLSAVFFLLVVSVASACDIQNIQLSCHNTHLKPLENITQTQTQPNKEQLCSVIKTAVPGFTTCMQAGMEGCNQDQRNQLQSILDQYNQGYAQYDALCEGGISPDGGGMCGDLMKCYDPLYKAIGVDINDGVSEEEQKKLEEFGKQMEGGLNGICGFPKKVKLGSIMECTQAAAIKCLSTDPFQGIKQIFSANSTDNMFLGPMVNHLRLLKPDGSINGTGWDLTMAYLCQPGCTDRINKLATLGSECNLNAAPEAGQNKTALCGEFQKKIDCAEEAAGDCPLLILAIHSMVKSISKEGQMAESCDLKVSKPLPDLDANDSAGVLAVSTFALMISVASVLMF